MDRQEIIRQYLKVGFAVIAGKLKSKNLWRYYFSPHPPHNKHTDRFIESITDENIGIYMGADLTAKGDDHPRYAYALDFDDEALYTHWKETNPDLASRCPTQRTRRGYHVLFTMPKHEPGGKSDDLTFVGDGWYILVAPSIHPDGHHYRWLKSPFDTPLPHVARLEDLGLGDRLAGLDWGGEDYPPCEDHEDAWEDLDERGWIWTNDEDEETDDEQEETQVAGPAELRQSDAS
jgi:hypothetical protein